MHVHDPQIAGSVVDGYTSLERGSNQVRARFGKIIIENLEKLENLGFCLSGKKSFIIS